MLWRGLEDHEGMRGALGGGGIWGAVEESEGSEGEWRGSVVGGRVGREAH